MHRSLVVVGSFLLAVGVGRASAQGGRERIVAEMVALEERFQKVAEKAVKVTVGLKWGPSHASAVIVSADGYVLTAAHCFPKPGMDVKLVFHDGRELAARTLGREERHDFAMIKITEKGPWPFAEMGDSSKVKKHDFVVGTGNPYELVPGRPPPVRVGRVEDNGRFLRTTCRVAPGDSGGPLFDLEGRVIGIHSFISSGMTYNFQVPVNRYKDDWKRLAAGEQWNLKRRGGKPRATFGIEVEPVDGGGARVKKVEKAGPAAKAGLTVGDVILSVGKRTIVSPRSYKLALAEALPGVVVKVRVRRPDGEHVLEITPAAIARKPPPKKKGGER